MIDPETQSPDERYVYQERLALLGLTEQDPTEQEHKIAMQDVSAYRKKVRELTEKIG